jgi:hypothetical protein
LQPWGDKKISLFQRQSKLLKQRKCRCIQVCAGLSDLWKKPLCRFLLAKFCPIYLPVFLKIKNRILVFKHARKQNVWVQPLNPGIPHPPDYERLFAVSHLQANEATAISNVIFFAWQGTGSYFKQRRIR